MNRTFRETLQLRQGFYDYKDTSAFYYWSNILGVLLEFSAILKGIILPNNGEKFPMHLTEFLNSINMIIRKTSAFRIHALQLGTGTFLLNRQKQKDFVDW